MKFSQYIGLFEDVPVGLKNKEIWFDYLKEKYSKSKDLDKLYISFVNVDKVGINPKSPYDTPIGVYTYPLEWVLENEDVPFRGEVKPKKVKVLKAISGKVLNNDLTEAEYDKLIEKLRNLKQWFLEMSFEKFVMLSAKKARKQTPFGRLWNVTRVISSQKYADYKSKDQSTQGHPVSWNKILRELGFDYVQDNGDGIIHPSEPTQAVFLIPKAYKIIDEEFIDSEERFKETNGKETKDLIEKISKGWNWALVEQILKEKKFRLLKVSTDDDVDALSYSIRFQIDDNGELFKKLVPYFQKELKENFVMYFNKAMTFLKNTQTENPIFDYFVKLNDKRMYSPEISIGKFLKYMDRTITKFEHRKEIIEKLKQVASLDGLEDALK